MKIISLFMLCLLLGKHPFAQDAEYFDFARTADSLYSARNYIEAAHWYTMAFASYGWKGTLNDRYNAACSWALAGHPDSAFYQLNRIATRANYAKYEHVSVDPDLLSLHDDSRWDSLLVLVKQNKQKLEANYNWALVRQLDTIFQDDQNGRLQIEEMEEKYGRDSREMQDFWKMMVEKDSINLIKVTKILDEHGWLGPDIVSEQGNTALFLVIQHGDITTQEKYLPMMREAVTNGKAKGSSLALLEDRVALRQGKKQIYGSQIGREPETGRYYVQPLEDPDHVDERRASVGLSPLAEYVSMWGIPWDVEKYKKALPVIEEIERMKREKK